MPTTQDYINQLKIDKQNLVSMLNGMGVEASNNETFTSLTPKVGKIVTDPILQDKSITITENGTQTITADEGYNGLNNVEVITNIASGSSTTNLFIQEEEPTHKNGLWLQTSNIDIQNIKNIGVYGNEISIDLGAWNPVEDNEQLPYNFYLGSTAIVGHDIYIFFNETVSGVNALYKYDTKKNTYTRLTDVPFNSNRSTANVIGTDIYIFGSSVSPYNYAYKYDTLTDTYTRLADSPYQTYNASSVAYGNDIYLFGGASSVTNTYKYNIKTNTYTKLANMPLNLSAGRATIVGDTVYLFGLASGYTSALKYNITTATYTQLKNTYGAARCLLVPVGNYIFIMGSSYNTSVSKKCYKFDTTNDTFIELNNLPFDFGQGGGGLVGNKIYLIGSKFEGNEKIVQSVNVSVPDYDENSIVLSSTPDNRYRTKLLDSPSIECDFVNCYIYDVDTSIVNDSNIPMYYGDGTQWNKFKN